MKRFFLILFLFLIITPDVYGVSPEANTKEKAQELKEKIATKVAELQKKEKRVFYGVIQANNKDIITVATQDEGDIDFTLTENAEITFLLYGKSKKIDISKLLKGQKIIAWGEYEKLTKTFSANKIIVKPTYVKVYGTVSKIDSRNYILTIKDQNNKEMEIEVEAETVIKKAAEDKLNMIGFSKINLNDLVLSQAVQINVNGRYTPTKLIIINSK